MTNYEQYHLKNVLKAAPRPCGTAVGGSRVARSGVLSPNVRSGADDIIFKRRSCSWPKEVHFACGNLIHGPQHVNFCFCNVKHCMCFDWPDFKKGIRGVASTGRQLATFRFTVLHDGANALFHLCEWRKIPTERKLHQCAQLEAALLETCVGYEFSSTSFISGSKIVPFYACHYWHTHHFN